MPTVADCVRELQACLADLQQAETQNAAEQAEVTAALKALGATASTTDQHTTRAHPPHG